VILFVRNMRALQAMGGGIVPVRRQMICPDAER
jgi:hypothetical protein